MPRTTLALLLALSLVAAPALAQQVGISGSVLPSTPTGFPLPDIPITGGGPFDLDNDGLADFISTTGNQLDLRFIDQDDPTGAVNPAGAFNAIDVWRGYDTPQNILVGNAGAVGTLTIANNAQLRYQHLVLGGVSQDAVPNSGLDVAINSSVNFDVASYLGATAPGQGGSGTLVVTGVGSVYNNAFNEIPADLQAALNLGMGTPLNDIVTDLAAATQPVPGSSFNLTTRERANGTTGGYDVVVGLNGSGRLQIDNGGRVEVQDALMVAVDESSSGDVVVDGFGSQLIAFGRIELNGGNGGQLDLGANVLSSTEATSFIGGRGRGTLAVTGAGRADFRNGLAIGTPTGAVETASDGAAQGSGAGSGLVEVSGAGSVLNAFSSALGSFDFGDGDGMDVELALAVGDIRAGGLDSTFDPTVATSDDANLQTGELLISDGGTVNALAAVYGGTDADAPNALIGKNGSVRLADGALLVGDQLLVDGDLSGYGTVQTGTLDTSTFSVIRGGNPNSENPALAQPLRLVVNDVKDRSGATNGTANDSLLNRGLIDGVVDITSTGRLLNEGDITVSGEINTGSLTTTVASTLVGARSGGAPLRIRVSSDEAVSDGALIRGEELAGDVAFQNNGLLDGEVDVIVTGAFLNGTDQTTVAPSATGGLSNGGVIRATGSIRAGVFLNHRLGVIEVGQGETLSILADGQSPGGVGPVTYANAIIEDGFDSGATGGADGIADGTPALFSAANLGTINVVGGTLDTGAIDDDREAIVGGAINHFRLFRNARAFNATEMDETIGTITANDAQINFREGVYNTGVIAFSGGTNTVTGRVFNAADIDYDSGGAGFIRPGIIVVSGSGTTVTFVDTVQNDGLISIGPFDNVVNILGNLEGTGDIQIALTPDGNGGTVNESAVLVVGGTVDINGAITIVGPPVGSLMAAPLAAGLSVDIIDGAFLTAETRFTEFDLPTLEDGLFWDIVYDEANGDIRAEVIASLAIGADFTGDGVVDLLDLDVWTANAGILAGASTIQGDADLDGDVDLDDFGLLQQQLLTGVPVAAILPANTLVPEPTAALLLALAACGLPTRRR